jgi:UDP-4-amino-4,6-dideoxy-N-acetyl-beta-L-altrosamine transaminase
MNRFLPYTRQTIEDADIAAVAAVLRSDFLTTGPAVTAFENALAHRVGAAHAIACANGTAALHLAALALGLGPGDTAIVPAVTFVATANCARYAGADVVFADVDPDTGLMRPEDLRAAIGRAGPGAKAVLPVHLGGQPCDMAAIGAIARDAGSSVIEDAAHAIGTIQADGTPVGACGESAMTIFSFHPAKTIAMGEGGAVTTNDAATAERLRLFCAHGIVRAPDHPPGYYEMRELGFNYRLSDIHCALGLSQLERLDALVAKRTDLVAAYDREIARLAPIVKHVRRPPGGTTGWHLYQALIDFDAAGKARTEVMIRLREAGIGTQVHYIPVHRQPYYAARGAQPDLPGAEAFYDRCLSLPLFAGMSEDDVVRVVGTLETLLS